MFLNFRTSCVSLVSLSACICLSKLLEAFSSPLLSSLPPLFSPRLKEQLGSGQFGRVCKGLWRFTAVTMEVAVKTLKPRAPDSQKVKFLQEAAIMGQFSSHPNVVKLFGVVTMGEPVSTCVWEQH